MYVVLSAHLVFESCASVKKGGGEQAYYDQLFEVSTLCISARLEKDHCEKESASSSTVAG
jgi:hypothetical protein